jgi:hypothetical protein
MTDTVLALISTEVVMCDYCGGLLGVLVCDYCDHIPTLVSTGVVQAVTVLALVSTGVLNGASAGCADVSGICQSRYEKGS